MAGAFNWTVKSSSRGGAEVRLVTIHTAEGIRKARDLVAYFSRIDIESSCHACADDTELLQAVPYDRAAWTLRRGNPISDNLELCAFAAWSREEWLRHDGMLSFAAAWIAERCKARGIPCVKIGPDEVRAGKAGVIGHIDWTDGMRDGTHWDPGPNFPWDVVMARANGNNTPLQREDDMTPEQDQMLRTIYNDNRIEGQPYGRIAAGFNDVRDLIKQVTDLTPAINETFQRVRGSSPAGDMLQLIYALCLNLTASEATGGVDINALAAKLQAGLGDSVAKSLGEKLAS